MGSITGRTRDLGRHPAPEVGRTRRTALRKPLDEKGRCIVGVMKLWHRIKIDELERGLVFRDGAPVRLLGPGRYFLADPRRHLRIEKVSIREPWFVHADLERIVKSGVLDGQALILDLNEYERAIVWIDGNIAALRGPGLSVLWLAHRQVRADTVSLRKPWLAHSDLERIVKSGVLGDQALVLDLKDHERAIVWIDGRIDSICSTGLHVLWTAKHENRVETIDARSVRFEHPDLSVILTARGASAFLETSTVEAGWIALVFQNGRLTTTLEPGVHAFWRGEGALRILHVDLREQTAEISGQEIMTADKVTLRLNAMVAYRVVDPVQAVTAVENFSQVLYRQAQLALRALVGTRELDALLSDKDGVAAELETTLRARAAAFGMEVRSVGVRDLILPGEMKTLLNRVTEARKAAEAALITRREETAAIRSQANTARIFESNPTLMRLRELEVLEKVAEKANLSVVLGEGGLAERVVKLL